MSAGYPAEPIPGVTLGNPVCDASGGMRCALEVGHDGPHAPDRLVAELIAGREADRITELETENARMLARLEEVVPRLGIMRWHHERLETAARAISDVADEVVDQIECGDGDHFDCVGCAFVRAIEALRSVLAAEHTQPDAG